ncbi:hypothetical protein BCR36DRAFT_343705 [Piromyces finnis]|uniref:Rap-GAP domain-containing protein n=1 Tax=Piromyces finnis TaxID=1754191 RepID=A0A1Y1VLU0_9FUNG|nr:hypothetical protein BCR36DRAFT_343705 [Piromyces finnis]|eukprot:ORX58457.1 hypothetical protein BCR36DRAFT_343705 [Piromyces finnis]
MSSGTKKTEKLQKKFKVFYDTKIKLKTRLSSLKVYLENVDVVEKRRVCIENYDLIFNIHWKIFENKHERLQASREKTDKPVNHNSKEINDIVKVLRDSIKLLDFCLDGANKNCEDFDKLVEKSINSTVSYRIRVEGLLLLLIYLNITKSDNPKYINLYKNAVHLENFGTFPYPEPMDFAVRDIDDSSKIIPTGKISRIEQSSEKIENEILLFNIILDNILYLLYKQKSSNDKPLLPDIDETEENINDNANDNNTCNNNENDSKKDDLQKQEILKNIVFDDSKTDIAPLNIIQEDCSNSLNYMWNLLQIHYLDKFFPGIAENEVDLSKCFSICPSCIIKNLLDFYVLLFSIINENNGEFLNELSKNTFIYQYLESSQQDGIPILNKNYACNGIPTLSKLNEQNGSFSIKQILLSHNNVYTTFCYEVQVNTNIIRDYFFRNEYKENLLFEILRQSLLQGFNKYEVIAETIGIIHSNIFLKCNNIYDNDDPNCISYLNGLIRKFIKALRLVFLERKDIYDKNSKEKIYIYTKIFNIFQYIVTQQNIKIENETWKILFSSLLSIHNQIIVYNKNSLYRESKDTVRLLVETMFYIWTQSPVMEEKYWIQLKEELSVSINEWEQVIDEWNKIMICLTNDLSKYAFNINLEVHNKNDKFKRNRSKSCVVEGVSNNIPIPYIGENDIKKQFNMSNTISTPLKLNNKALTISNNNSFIISELNQNEKESKKIQYNIKRNLTIMEIMNIWKNTLCVIGNPNKIKKPIIYSTCMESLERIWNLLEKIRNNQQYVNNIYPPILEFSSWIFQSVDLPKELNNGKVVAFRIMCKMMFHKFEYIKEKEYYYHFYLCILKGLHSGENDIIFEIFDNCKSLYSNYLPGSSILIPPFINVIKTMIPSRLESLPSFFFQNCIILLNSIYTWCNLYKNEEIPCFELDNDQEKEVNEMKKTTFLKIRVEIFEILSSIHSTKNYQNYIKSKKSRTLLSNMHFRVIFEELVNPELEFKENDNNKSIISEYILLIMQQLDELDSCIVLNAINSMDTLSQNYNLYKNKLPPHLNEVIIENFIGIIEKHLKGLKNGDESDSTKTIISKIMYCFLNWLMVIPTLSKSTWIKIFEILERIYNLPDDDNTEKFNQTPTDSKNKQKLSRGIYSQHEIKITKLFDKKYNTLDSNLANPSFISEKTSPEEKKNILKTTAEYIINHILHFLGSFPTAYGPSTQESSILEDDFNDNDEIFSNNYIFFSINDTSIITLQELSKSNPLECQNRCIIRNITGKYVWDSNLFFESLEKVKFLFNTKYSALHPCEDILDYPINYYNDNILILRNKKIESFKDEESIDDIDDDPYHKSLKSPYNDNISSLPKYNCIEYKDSEDAVENLLLYISQKHPECLIKPNTYLSDIVPDFPDHQISNLESIRESEIQQLKYEKALNIERRKMIDVNTEKEQEMVNANFNLEYDISYLSRNNECKETPIPTNSVVFPYQFCRLYMTHVGLLMKQIVDSKKKICMLNNTKALIRDIKGLDKKNGRETIKIGVLYIKLGQETECSILENETGSDEYNQFVLSLGWEIDLEKHNGYTGGLDKNKTKENKAIYYCDSTLEIIFHDITKFPNDPNDKTHIKKKRHIGNDQIHIIWNEHNRNYRSKTIGGDFGNIQIIITPLNNGLYSVCVEQDDNNIILGPLSNTMLVSKYALGPLVRATAIYAYRQIVYQDEIMYYHPYNQRLDNINTIISRHKSKNFSYDYLLNNIFMNKEDVNNSSTLKNTTINKNLNNNTGACPQSPHISKVVSASGISAINFITNSNSNNSCNNTIKNKDNSNSNNSCNNTIKSKDNSNQNSSETISSITNTVKMHLASPITKLPSASFNLKKKRNISTTAIDTLIHENDPIAVLEDNIPQMSNNSINSNNEIKKIKTSKSTLFA